VTDPRKYSERIVPPVADPLATAVHLAGARPGAQYVCYEGPQGWAFACGVAAELIIDRDRAVLHTEDGTTSVPMTWDDDPLRHVPALLDTLPIEGWRVYGWTAFDLAPAKEGLLDLTGDGTLLHLFVPRTELRLYSTGTLIRALDPDDLDGLQSEVDAVRTPSYHAEPVAVGGSDAYLSAVGDAVTAINDGRLQKVILSRTVAVEQDVDLVGTYYVGRRANSPARSYLLSLGDHAAAGFSPETVIEVTEDGMVTTQPLAGTRALTGDAARDTVLRAELLADAKEIHEHAISVKVAYDELVALCGESEVTEFMVVRERGTVQHLASSVRGQLPDGAGPWDAFAALYPAVTVSGVPKPAAYAVIRELEETGRGLYGGSVLVYDRDGALDAALVLRTVFRRGDETWLRAGAGIVGQSTTDRELTETCEKLSSVARYVVPIRQEVLP
jgi:salicylate synthase